MKFDRKLAHGVLDEIRIEANKYHQTGNASFVLNVVEAVAPVICAIEKGSWTQKMTAKVHKNLGITTESDQPTQKKRRELFRTNVALSYVLKNMMKMARLKVRKLPSVNFFPRPYLSLERTEKLIQSIDDYHMMLVELLKKSPNINTPKSEMFSNLMLAMIALDGQLSGIGDRKLSLLKKEDVHIGDISSIDIRIGKETSRPIVYKRYPISDYTASCLKFVLKRTPDDGYLFPEEWRVKGHKKTIRRKDLESFIANLWFKTFPHRNVPVFFDVPFWIKISAISMEELGVPYFIIANGRNKIRAAQISKGNLLTKRWTFTRGAVNGGFTLLSEIGSLLDEFDKKDKTVKTKRMLVANIRSIVENTDKKVNISRNEHLIVGWLKWFLQQKKSKDITISTFRGYTSTLSNRVVPFLHGDCFDQLKLEEWEKLIENVSTDVDYASSSRRKSIIDIRSFYTYLQGEYPNLPIVDFDDYRFRVSRDYPECPVIFPSEVEKILATLTPGSTTWLAVVFAFFCGLRCEEICHLGVDDFQAATRLVVRRSKLESSRRTVPWGWLIPEPYYQIIQSIIADHKLKGYEFIIHDGDGFQLNNDTLSKSVGRMLIKKDATVQKLHGLRHGFASVQLFRYFMLSDSKFYADFMAGKVVAGLDPSAHLFRDEMMEKMALIIGGMPWLSAWRQKRQCPGTSTDLIPISKLLGHASRFTTIENYFNSTTWIQRYYLDQRIERIKNARWSFDF